MPAEIEGMVDYGTMRLTRKARNTFSILGSFSLLQNVGDDAEVCDNSHAERRRDNSHFILFSLPDNVGGLQAGAVQWT